MRAAIYARVSTSNHGQDPSMQTRELRDYCDRRGLEIVGEYVDSGISGAKERRPQLDRLMTDCRLVASMLCLFTAMTDSLGVCAIW